MRLQWVMQRPAANIKLSAVQGAINALLRPPRDWIFIGQALHSHHVTTHAVFTFPISLTCYESEGSRHADAEDDEV